MVWLAAGPMPTATGRIVALRHGLPGPSSAEPRAPPLRLIPAVISAAVSAPRVLRRIAVLIAAPPIKPLLLELLLHPRRELLAVPAAVANPVPVAAGIPRLRGTVHSVLLRGVVAAAAVLAGRVVVLLVLRRHALLLQRRPLRLRGGVPGRACVRRVLPAWVRVLRRPPSCPAALLRAVPVPRCRRIRRRHGRRAPGRRLMDTSVGTVGRAGRERPRHPPLELPGALVGVRVSSVHRLPRHPRYGAVGGKRGGWPAASSCIAARREARGVRGAMRSEVGLLTVGKTTSGPLVVSVRGRLPAPAGRPRVALLLERGRRKAVGRRVAAGDFGGEAPSLRLRCCGARSLNGNSNGAVDGPRRVVRGAGHAVNEARGVSGLPPLVGQGWCGRRSGARFVVVPRELTAQMITNVEGRVRMGVMCSLRMRPLRPVVLARPSQRCIIASSSSCQ